MRKLTLLTFLAVTLAVPLQARNKDQSYISYDDGGTIVRAGDDNREMEARVNLPVYPGDEVITNRRGRAEIRLSDGNVVGIDRGTAIRFQSMLDNYEGEDDATIAELRYGKVMVYRSADARDAIRIDTPSASYVASREATFSVEADTSGKDRVSVFDGTIEVRTPARTTRLRSGERAEVDERGLYALASDQGYGSDDFERWFVKRTERYGRTNSRYLDRSLAYYEDDLNRYGSWSYISGYGYGWRPYGISAGWRPYYYGQWGYGRRSGCLTWVSYEPWGWAPYHYGRWSHDPFHGWFWLPGSGYSPAWVYWWYGSGYLGWAPAGYWDGYRPYYNWAYRPYSRGGHDIGFGFYGRVRAHDVDLRPWTFIDSKHVISTRIDRAAMTTDVIRGRLFRDKDGSATIGMTPARFTRTELRDPAAAVEVIARRGGAGAGVSGPGFGRDADLTSFIRRDPEVSGPVRERIMRSRPVDTPTSSAGAAAPSSIAPIGRGSVAPISGGSVAPIGGGSVAPIGGGNVAPTNSGEGRVNRGGDNNAAPTNRDSGGRVRRNQESRPAEQPAPRTEGGGIQGPTWRDRVTRAPAPSAPVSAPAPDAPVSRTPETRDNSWRGRVVRGGSEPTPARDAAPAPRAESPERASDVPRRVIDRIGGPRLVPSDGERPSSRGRDSGRDSSPPPSRPASVDRPSRDSSPPPQRESPPPRASEGKREGGRSEGGRIKRDKQE